MVHLKKHGCSCNTHDTYNTRATKIGTMLVKSLQGDLIIEMK